MMNKNDENHCNVENDLENHFTVENDFGYHFENYSIVEKDFIKDLRSRTLFKNKFCQNPLLN